jgi:choline dehydrogenase-like flavoprotein
LEFPNIEIITRTKAVRLITDDAGKIVTAVEVERDGEIFRPHASRYVVSCGAVNWAILLLRSANAAYPNGLANSSGLVGRNYMVHNNTALMAVHPIRKNPTVFQKTTAIYDFYLRGAEGWRYPLGNLQLLGYCRPVC